MAKNTNRNDQIRL